MTVTGTSIVGIPACANGAFINDVLRGQWGWEGYVVSDCSAIANVLATHHYVETPEAAAEVCMAAGEYALQRVRRITALDSYSARVCRYGRRVRVQ